MPHTMYTYVRSIFGPSCTSTCFRSSQLLFVRRRIMSQPLLAEYRARCPCPNLLAGGDYKHNREVTKCSKAGLISQKGCDERTVRDAIVSHLTGSPYHRLDPISARDEADFAELETVMWEKDEWDKYYGTDRQHIDGGAITASRQATGVAPSVSRPSSSSAIMKRRQRSPSASPPRPPQKRHRGTINLDVVADAIRRAASAATSAATLCEAASGQFHAEAAALTASLATLDSTR